MSRARTRRNVLPADVLARLAPLLSSIVGDAKTLSQRFGFRRSTAQQLLDGTAAIVVDSDRARKLVGLLVQASDNARRASTCHDHADRLAVLARRLGERAYCDAVERMRCNAEAEQWRLYRDVRIAFKAGVNVAPCFSSNGLPLLIAVGENRELRLMAEAPIADDPIFAEFFVLEAGVHYAPWIPASGIGCTLLAVGADNELVAWTDIEEKNWTDMLRAAIEARRDLEALLEISGTSTGAWHESSDDDDDDDSDDAGEGWKSGH